MVDQSFVPAFDPNYRNYVPVPRLPINYNHGDEKRMLSREQEAESLSFRGCSLVCYRADKVQEARV